MTSDWPPRSLADLQLIVAEGLEETTRLEFKRQLPTPGHNDDLARDIAAMANTDGGVIIYGIEENSGLANALRPFHIAGAPERIAQVAISQIDEGVVLDSMAVIRDDKEPNLGYLVVEVAPSTRRPHFTKGAAWGRSPRNHFPLSRRQIGQLFADAPGFAQEFGITLDRPALVRATTSRREDWVSGQMWERKSLIFENTGERPAYEVDWSCDSLIPAIFSNPFPLSELPPGGTIPVQVTLGMNMTNFYEVKTNWLDARGNRAEQVWPISW